MTRVVRNAALFCVAGILVASAAFANVPDPAHSTLGGAFISVAGLSPGSVPDLCSDTRCPDYTLTVRDFANNPVANATVVVDFSACPDIKIASTQIGRTPGQLALCPKQVQGTTSATGTLTLTIEGAGIPNTAPGTFTVAPPVGSPCAQIYANGVALSSGLFVSSYDPNGSGGVNGADASTVAAGAAGVLVGGPQYERMDINKSGSLNGADASAVAQMAADVLVGTGSTTTGPFCP